MSKEISKSASSLGEAFGTLVLNIQETDRQEKSEIAADTFSGFMDGFGDYTNKINWRRVKWGKLFKGLAKIFEGIGDIIDAFSSD